MKVVKTFCQDQDQDFYFQDEDQDSGSQDQDQDQDFYFQDQVQDQDSGSQDQDQDFYFQDQVQDQDSGSQDQDQDFIFCPRGASRPRLWSRGLHHWYLLRFGPTDKKCLQRLSETDVWQVRLSEVCRQIVPDSRSSCTKGFVAQVGQRPTDEKRSSISRAQSSWAGVGDDAALIYQVYISWEHVQVLER